MEVAKVTSKGQITIPVSIRRRLGINEGDRLMFIDRPDGVLMVNPEMFQAESPEKPPETQQVSGRAPVLPFEPDAEDTPVAKDILNAQKAQDSHDSQGVRNTQGDFKSPPEKTVPAVEPEEQPQTSEGPRNREKDYDIAALLNEIRSMGSNI